MQGDERIGKDNFFKLTRGRFEPCPTPRRAPDRVTKDSSYWFDDQGVTRRSDHWGWGIATCTWTYGDDEACHCGKTKRLGERTGRVAWDALETPRVEIHLTHQFGDLDYDAIGARPVSRDVDEYGPYDVFVLTRDMVSDKGGKVVFAGNEIVYGNGRDQINLSAAGGAYKDPAARSISSAWKAERDAARADKRRVKLSDWLPTQVGDPVHGDLAARTAKQVTPAQWAALLPHLGQDTDHYIDRSPSDARDGLYFTEVTRRPAGPGAEEGEEAVYSFISDSGYLLESECLLSVTAPAGADPMEVIADRFRDVGLLRGEEYSFNPERDCVGITGQELQDLTIANFDGSFETTFLNVFERIPAAHDQRVARIASPMLREEIDLALDELATEYGHRDLSASISARLGQTGLLDKDEPHSPLPISAQRAATGRSRENDAMDKVRGIESPEKGEVR